MCINPKAGGEGKNDPHWSLFLGRTWGGLSLVLCKTFPFHADHRRLGLLYAVVFDREHALRWLLVEPLSAFRTLWEKQTGFELLSSQTLPLYIGHRRGLNFRELTASEKTGPSCGFMIFNFLSPGYN